MTRDEIILQLSEELHPDPVYGLPDTYPEWAEKIYNRLGLDEMVNQLALCRKALEHFRNTPEWYDPVFTSEIFDDVQDAIHALDAKPCSP